MSAELDPSSRSEDQRLLDVQQQVKGYVSCFPGVQICPTVDIVAYVTARLAQSAAVAGAEDLSTVKAAWEGDMILVDVREEAEMDVSVIPFSISKAKFERDLKNNLDKNVRIVPYCTIGMAVCVL